MKKVFILGTNGFIGHHLSRAILATTDWQIVGMDLGSHRLQSMLANPRMRFHERDMLTVPRGLTSRLPRVTWFCHS